jgi:hypothetical protein
MSPMSDSARWGMVGRHQAQLDAAARVTEQHQQTSVSRGGAVLSQHSKTNRNDSHRRGSFKRSLHRHTFSSHRSGSASVCIVVISTQWLSRSQTHSDHPFT